MITEYTKFQNQKETIKFLKKYDLIAPKSYSLPIFWHKLNNETTYTQCEVLGYEEEYDDWAALVIDYGTGPVGIHSDFFRDMQKIERNKGKSLTKYTDTFVVFDLETTGIYIKSAEIIEISAIKYVNGKEIEIFNEFVKPKRPIPNDITKLTGITDLDVYNADDISVVLKKFIDFIGNFVLVGHNIDTYDLNLIYDYAKRLFNIDISNNFIDTMKLGKSLYKGILPNCKLTTIAGHFGIDTSNAHRALADCRMTLECYQKMFKDNESYKILPMNNITNEFDSRVIAILDEIIKREELPACSLFLAPNLDKYKKINSQSICINEPEYPANSHNLNQLEKNDVILQYQFDKKWTFYIHDIYINFLTFPDSVTLKKTKSDGLFTRVIIDNIDEQIYDFVRDIIKVGLDNYESSSSFGCCSQYMKCSDEKKCVHENKLYSKGCQYRKNLDAGRIFYGKNRNID